MVEYKFFNGMLGAEVNIVNGKCSTEPRHTSPVMPCTILPITWSGRVTRDATVGPR